MYAIHAGKAALNAHYKRLGWNARAQEGAVDGWYQTKFTLKEEPLVSILIPNKDHTDDLDVCLNSFFERADYQNYEFIIIIVYCRKLLLTMKRLKRSMTT